MGNSLFADGNNLENNTLSNLPQEQIDFLDDNSDLYHNFHRIEKTRDIFQVARAICVIHSEKENKLFWLSIKEKYPNNTGELTELERRELTETREHLLKDDSILDGRDLDCLWSMYFATGDMVYVNRIYSAAIDVNQNVLIRGAAIWSFNSNKNAGRFESDLSFAGDFIALDE